MQPVWRYLLRSVSIPWTVCSKGRNPAEVLVSWPVLLKYLQQFQTSRKLAHIYIYASLARGFLIFLRIPMRVVKSDWNPHPHACRKRRLCRKRVVWRVCSIIQPLYICLLGCVHPWRVWLAKQETLTPPGHLVSPLVLGRNQGSLHAHYSSQSS